MGSEFSYEDMSSQEVAKYTYKWLRDEPCGENACFVVEQYPVYESSGYKRRIVWIDKELYTDFLSKDERRCNKTREDIVSDVLEEFYTNYNLMKHQLTQEHFDICLEKRRQSNALSRGSALKIYEA